MKQGSLSSRRGEEQRVEKMGNYSAITGFATIR
jgi:hypothetical protein